jgi:hypothetical protein
MTQKTTFPPDLLRRFAPAPYVFSIVRDHQCVWIEANDLEVALAIRRSCMLQSKESRTRVLFWELIRDSASPRGGSEILAKATDVDLEAASMILKSPSNPNFASNLQIFRQH